MGQENGSHVPAVTTPETPQAPQPRQRLIVTDTSENAHLMDTARFEHMGRIAAAMANASLLPDHLVFRKRGTEYDYFSPEQIKANCFLIVNQSLRWGFDPFSVMPETYVVGGKLAYQGKLIAAVVNTRAGLEDNLSYKFSGTKGTDDFTVTVSGTRKGESEPRIVTLSVGEAKTSNSMWSKDPEQKLIYSAAVKWARRHCPEVILGVVTTEDGEAIQDAVVVHETPAKPRLFTLREMQLTTGELERGETTIEAIMEKAPNLDPGQLAKLKLVQVISPGEADQTEHPEGIRLETKPAQ